MIARILRGRAITRMVTLLSLAVPLVSLADFQMTNPVTGEAESYTWKFVGTDTWNGTGNWQDSSGANPSGTPAKSGENVWAPILFDGNTININAGMSVEGWNLRMGLYNGANVRMNSFVKYQGDTTMWMTVDENSQLTIGGFGGGNITGNQAIKLSVAKANGITWNVNLASGNANNTFEYYLKGAGSVSYQAVSAANHKIKMADVTLTGTSQVSSKTLVSFSSTTKTFTADAAIKVYDTDGTTLKKLVGVTAVRQSSATIANTSSALTTADAVGTCEIVQCTDGIVLYWVDGDPAALTPTVYKPSISINFTTGTSLSTAADVGISEYAIPGTSWNNLIGNNGSLTTVTRVDSTGAASTISGANVTISGTRGYWRYNDNSGATTLYNGYIDDNNNGSDTPTVVVEGIPYDAYKLVVYFSNDTDGTNFGYITVNGAKYKGDNGSTVACEGTSSDKWGSANHNAWTEGGNYLVTPVIPNQNGTLTLISHDLAGCRSGVAAIQIVESVVEGTTVEPDGTYVIESALDQVVKLVCEGSFTITGTDSYTVTETDLAKLTLNAVAGTVTLGAYTCYALDSSRTLPAGYAFGEGSAVKIAETTAEYGTGVFAVSGLTGVSTVVLTRVDGTSEEIAVTEGVASLNSPVQVSGKACWIDYEMSYGAGKTGFENTGTSTLALQKDSGIDGSNAFTDDGMLYTYAHPYREGLTIPSTWTAVVRCTVPNYPDAAVIIFGWNDNYIGLVAGETPKTEMRLVQYKTGYDHYVTNAVMNVQDATTAQHVYIFAVENSQTLKVYCDGTQILNKVLEEPLTITSGFQVGSVLGGATGGIVRFAKNESPANTLSESVQKDARIDCVRLYDYSLSADQIAALSEEFPAVKLYEATVAADADTSWESLEWSNDWDGGNAYSKVLLTVEGDATVALPESITAEELAFEVAAGSTLTLKGPGSLAVTRAIDAIGYTLKLDGTVTFAADTTMAGNIMFASGFTNEGDGDIQLSNGATVGVDAALVVTPLGTYTCAEGTVADAAYTGDGVKLIPLTSAVVSITQSGTTLYYSDLDTALGPLVNAPTTISDDVVVTLLNGTTLPAGYDTYLLTAGYYINGNVITKAVARIGSTTYPTLADAVGAAADGATVTLLRASSEAITLTDKAITLSETANFSGTLTGNGTLTFAAFRNNPSITFDNWTGTVVLPSFAADGTKLNSYGVAGSTVVLKGITGGWFGETAAQTMTVSPVLQLDGDVTIKGFSTSWDYTFAEITGTGNFSLDPTDNSPKSATITKVAEGFTGAITNTTTVPLTIGTLERASGTSTAFDAKLLGATGNVVASALTVGGESVAVPLVTKEDGIYVGAVATVTAGESVTSYSTLAAAVAGATDGATVTLLADVTLAARIEPNLGAGTELTIDLGGYTITREGTSGNGSAFRVMSGTVTIKNGTVNCTQDDTAIVANGVYAIDVKNAEGTTGAAVVLETLSISVNSQNGACVYPWAGTTATIKSGTYVNNTQTVYQYGRFHDAELFGMAVNQANVATQLLFLEGGSFKQVDPKLGDDSGEMTDFCADGKTTELQDGWYVVVDIPPAGFDNGDGGTFTIADQAGITLPTGKTLADVASAATGLTYAQAWALGLLNETTGELTADLAATIEVTGGKVVVKINGEPKDGYLVTLKVFEKATLAAEWPAEPTKTYSFANATTTDAKFTTGDAGFYKVKVSITNALQN